MGVRWLVNAGLLMLPVGATVGILLGVDSQRQATGQQPLFNPQPAPGGGSTGSNSGTTTSKNGVTNSRYCQTQAAVAPPAEGAQYILNPNQWGWKVGDPGALCMNVTTFENNTYATATSAPQFSVTWQYPPGPDTQPVHAFPNVQIGDGVLPLQLSSLKNIELNMHWTYGVGNLPATSTSADELNQNLVNTNVAIDMFLDSDKENPQNSSKAAYEVMVWFADFGSAAQPIGLETGIAETQVLNGTTFNLYTGQNGLGQNVLTWLAATTTEVFTGDINPLLATLISADKPNYPTAALWLGHLGMGTEAFSSNVNVTFSMPVYSIDIQT